MISKQEFAQGYLLTAGFILNQILQNINDRAVSVSTGDAVVSILLLSENKSVVTLLALQREKFRNFKLIFLRFAKNSVNKVSEKNLTLHFM